jgi:septal ring factor EnvC (AmiA/AmiB activator)
MNEDQKMIAELCDRISKLEAHEKKREDDIAEMKAQNLRTQRTLDQLQAQISSN